MLSDDAAGTVLRIDLAGFEMKEFSVGTRTFHSVDLLTDAFADDPGFPEVPCIAKVLAIPDQAGVTIEVIETGEPRVFPGLMLQPARPSWKEGDPEPPFEIDAPAYLSESLYPAGYAKVDPPSIFRDFRIARVAVYPLRYVPGRRELHAVPSITLRLKYGPGGAANPKTTPRKAIAPSFAAIYRSLILNYQSVLDREYDGLESGRDMMLCIVPDAYVNSFKPYAEWKHKSGIYTSVTKFSDIGATATNPDIIKNHISQVYHTWQDPPTYVLLVGDYGQFPIKLVNYDYTFANEDFFVELDGSDYFPEIMVGRWTHDNDYGLQNLTAKSLNYEKYPHVATTGWYKQAAVVGNNEYPSQLATKRLVRSILLENGGFTSVDTFMNHSPCYSNLSALISVLSGGRSFLNYRGEGWSTGWSAPCYHFTTSNVTSVNNGPKLTFVTSIGCGVAMFNTTGGNSFGEQWLELGTPVAPRGACAFLGPTSNTHTAYNNKIDKGIYVGMFQEEGIETAAQALLRGKTLMYEVFGNQHWVEYHYRVYTTLGDPSLRVWRDIPRPVVVGHPSVLSTGFNQVVVAVTDSAGGTPVEAAEVYISGDSVYAGGVTDAFGRATIAITPGSLDTLTIVVRGARVLPYQGSIVLTTEPEHVGFFGNPSVMELSGNGDGRINPNETGRMIVTLKNWGTQTATDVRATLSVPDTNLARVTVDSVSFGDLSPGGISTGSPFQFFVKPQCPVGYVIPLTVHVTSTAREWNYIHAQEVKGCVLEYRGWIVDDTGSVRRNFRIDPGETVRLHLSVGNVGEDGAPEVSGTLRTPDSRLAIVDSVGTFGTIPMGSAATNTVDYFVVSIPDTTLSRYYVPSSVLLYTHGGNYPYSVVDTFSLPVGVPMSWDPTGPDSYGYYAYSSDDTLFQQAPQFSWMEISGLGTRITGGGSDFTSTVSLPFTFRYYGLDYGTTRISSDGWIAFGNGSQTSHDNRALPSLDNINNMVAPFWDDLFAEGGGETGRLYYYNDVSQHRFIIEWLNVGHLVDSTWRETFQIHLLNPTYYPTPTGDGEIIFQYKKVAEEAGNTVGIENSTQQIGLQYVFDEQYDITASALTDSFAIKFTTQSPQFVVSVREEDIPPGLVGAGYLLAQNYPNPFNPSTKIVYRVKSRESVSLKVYDMLGREVATLVDEIQNAGVKSVEWDATGLASGVYFYRLSAGDRVHTRKLVLLR
jgi:hypothetical protein